MDLRNFKDLLRDEDGMGTVEVILIIVLIIHYLWESLQMVVVLVGLVVIFRNQITAIVNSLFKKITSRTDDF